MAEDATEDVAEGATEDAPSTFETIWRAVLDRWEDDKRHHAFLTFCEQHEALGRAAALYRAVESRGDASEAERAKAATQLKRIGAIALGKLDATPHERPYGQALRTLRWISVVVLIASLVALGFALAQSAG